MAKQTINLGTGELTGDGESIRSAFDKVNDNFDELYAKDATDVDLSSVNQSIIPDTDVTYDLGSATNRFRDLYLSGSSIDLGGTVISVVGGELQLGGVKIPTQADLNAAIAAPTGDLTGSVFADDSTTLVDAVNSKIVGDIETDSLVVNTSGFINFNGSNVLNGGTVEAQVLIAGNIGSTGDVEITGTLTVDGAGSLIETVTEGDASAIGGIAYSYNGVSIGVTANPVGDFNTEQSTIQVSSGEITLTSTAQQNGDPQYTSTGQLRVTPSNFRISLAPDTSWQGELTFDENEFRIPSDNIVGEGATLRLNNMSDISIPNEKGLSTFNLSIVNHPQYDYSISSINGNVISVTHFGGYPDPQVDWVMYDPNSNSTTAHPVIDVVAGAPGVWDVTLADDGYDYSQLNELILWDLDQQTDPRQISINSDGDLTGVTSINNVNTLTGVRDILGDAVDQWSYISSPTDNGTITNIAFGYFGEGGLQNIIYGATSIENLNIGPLGTGPDAPLIRTLVSEENGLAIDLDISSGTSGDVSGNITIGTGDVGTKGKIYLSADVDINGAGTITNDGDDNLQLASASRVNLQAGSVVNISADASEWQFDTNGSIILPTGAISPSSTDKGVVFEGPLTENMVPIDPETPSSFNTVSNGVNIRTYRIGDDLERDWTFSWDGSLYPPYDANSSQVGAIEWRNPNFYGQLKSTPGYDNQFGTEPASLKLLTYNGADGAGAIILQPGGDTAKWIFGTDSNLTFPDATVQTTAWAGGRVVTPPATSAGASGDTEGDIAFNGNYIYYCTTAYSGPSEVDATNYFDVTDGNGHYVRADVTTPSILGTGTLSVTNVMVGGVPSTEEVTSYELISGSTYRFFLANTTEPWNTLSTSRLEISPNIWKRVAWSGDTW